MSLNKHEHLLSFSVFSISAGTMRVYMTHNSNNSQQYIFWTKRPHSNWTV